MKTSSTRRYGQFHWGFRRAALKTLVFLVTSSTLVYAQPNIVASVKADLQARGVDLSGPCGAFQITARVAWTLRSSGAGLLDKPSGNNCQGRAVDIIIYPDGHAFDILTDAGGSNGPSWSPIDPVDASRWRAPTDPGDLGGAVGTQPVGVPSPPATSVPPQMVPSLDLSPILARLDAIYAQNERIYADETKQHTAQTATIIAAVDSPGWFRSVVSNRYFQMIVAGAGTWVATHQVMK